MKKFKKIGRIFLVLTKEEKYINSKKIKSVLIVDLEEGHLSKTKEAVEARFPYAAIKIISSNLVTGIMASLWQLREEQFSIVVTQSLHPAVIFFILCLFHCYLLIYNKFHQWFLIRKKTLFEFLAGRNGADRMGADWNTSFGRLSVARITVMVLLLPFIGIKTLLRFIYLVAYILINIIQLYTRRYYYEIFRVIEA